MSIAKDGPPIQSDTAPHPSALSPEAVSDDELRRLRTALENAEHGHKPIMEMMYEAKAALPSLLRDLIAARAQAAEMRGERDALRSEIETLNSAYIAFKIETIKKFNELVHDMFDRIIAPYRNRFPKSIIDETEGLVRDSDKATTEALDALRALAASADGSGGGIGE